MMTMKHRMTILEDEMKDFDDGSSGLLLVKTEYCEGRCRESERNRNEDRSKHEAEVKMIREQNVYRMQTMRPDAMQLKTERSHSKRR